MGNFKAIHLSCLICIKTRIKTHTGLNRLVRMKKALKHNSKFITFKYKNQNQMHRKHYLHALVILLGISWSTSKAYKS